MWPHSTTLTCYWFSCYLIFHHTDVLLILVLPHSSILICYWCSCDFIPAYWCVIDSSVTTFHHTEELLILMWSLSSILICYWLSWDLIPAYLFDMMHMMFYWFSLYLILAYWCVIDSRVTSFQHTEVLLILRWLHFTILMCYLFSW